MTRLFEAVLTAHYALGELKATGDQLKRYRDAYVVLGRMLYDRGFETFTDDELEQLLRGGR